MNCFAGEIEKKAADIKNSVEYGDLCFAMLTDSHMSEQGTDTCRNIKAVDDIAGFDFAVHLGNIINGNNPEKISGYLLDCELEKYRNAVGTQKLFVSRGNTDGWRDERFIGQLAENIVTDEMWYSHTSYIDDDVHVKRRGQKPYYYVDIPNKNIRLVFLCSYNYQIDPKLGLYEKYLGLDVEQAGWLMQDALNVCGGTKVLIFSHKIPKSRFENGFDPYIYEGFSTEPILAIIQQAKRRGINIVCWFGGGYGYDSEICVGGINFAVINSQLPCIVNSSKCKEVRFAENRTLNTVNQDCWDAVIVKADKPAVKIIRFGCGDSRIIYY